MKGLEKFWLQASEKGEIVAQKALSRKLLVWLVATHMTYTGLLAPDKWLMVSMLYMGTQWALDLRKEASATPTISQASPQGTPSP